MEQYFVASFFNNFLPTAIGGDAVRFVMLANDGIAKSHAGTMIMIERLIGFYALIMIAFVSSFFWSVPDQLFWLISAMSVAYTTLILLAFGLNYDNTFLQRFGILQRIKAAFIVYKSCKKSLLWVFLYSLIFQCVSIYISYYIAVALHIDISILPFLTLVPLVWFCTMIPIGFGGVGTREVSFAYLFLLIGIGTEQSLLISIGTYLTLLLSGLIGAGFFVLNMRGKNETLF
jgi:hypothetical protein